MYIKGLVLAKTKAKQFVYIVQALLEPSKCKIGVTNNLERRLKEYNNMTGKSKENIYQYLFTCEVKNMAQVENDLKEKYSMMREEKSKEIYFFNKDLFKHYVAFITTHPLFVKKETKKEIVKIVKKTTPTLEDRGTSFREVMRRAQKVDNDEFYTRIEDIEKELQMYPKSFWKNKTVFCNCDDAVGDTETRTSAFAIYFIKNFKELELKKLICTHYSGEVDLFNQGSKGYVFTKFGYRELDFKKEYPEGYNGSFDHPISLKLLKEETDIVCTNPPFSRAIEFWELLIKSKKKFLIISNITNAINTAYISYFKEKKVWAGFYEVDWFLTPKRELTRAAGFWFTNFKINNRPKWKQLKIIPLKEIPEKYRKYDDSKILLVDNNYIPSDYKKSFAVSARQIINGILENGYEIVSEKRYTPYKNGKECFARVLIQKEK